MDSIHIDTQYYIIVTQTLSNILTVSYIRSTLSIFTFSHLADAVIQSDLQGHSPEASRVKCLAQGHNVIIHSWESNRQPSD